MDSSSLPTGQPISSSGTSPKPPSKTSTSSIIALVLGILSLTCCGFLAGIPAIFIGRAELKKVEEGTSKTLAKIGMILGIVGTALSLLFTIVYVILIALGISTGMMQH